MIEVFLTFSLIGIAAGLLGFFYRNCLKVPNMIFNWWYDILKSWVLKGDIHCDGDKCIEPTRFWKMMAWIARPLGYCIYCNTQWIAFILCYIYLTSFDELPYWQDIVLGVVMASGVSHLLVCLLWRFVAWHNPDLDY